ncbi:MAG: hypothetical protein COB35_10935 [Gammaproteobacteria bacterium]|nr:MAG: hypothetical protein COB35_10935 [Gammaproteobacteria bacterium]
MIAIPLVTGLSGCVIAVGGNDKDGYSYSVGYEDREQENRANLNKLAPDMSYETVQNLMGVADFNENYQKNGESVHVLFYRTQRTHKDGLTTKDECTPLVFKHDVLVSWGDSAYKQL